MKKFTKLASFILAAGIISTSMVGCGGGDKSSASGEMYKIGVVQLVEHAALDQTYKGFVDGLKEAGFEEGKNLKLEHQNAQGEQANCQTIASKLVNDKNDLILAIATPAAQAVASATTEIPVLVTAVTDPQESKLVASNEAPGGNVTGTSDLTPVKQQMELLVQLVPNAKTVGMLYCSSEVNSKLQIDIAKEEAAALGLESKDFTVSNSNELQQVVESMVGKVDAIYAPTDNMVAAGMPNVSSVATANQIPIICGESGMLAGGGLATYGINYYNLGKLTAKQAVAILKDGKKPADMPIEYLTDVDLSINQDAAKALNITVPQELLDKSVK